MAVCRLSWQHSVEVVALPFCRGPMANLALAAFLLSPVLEVHLYESLLPCKTS